MKPEPLHFFLGFFQSFPQCVRAHQQVRCSLHCLLCWFQSFSHTHRHVSMTMTASKVAMVETQDPRMLTIGCGGWASVNNE